MSPHIADRAASLVALDKSDRERIAAEDHAKGCDPCAQALAEATELFSLLDQIPPPPPPSREVNARIVGQIRRDLALERLDRYAAPFAVVLAWLLFIALARHRAGDTASWLESVAALGGAFVCTLLARYGRTGVATAGAVASAALLVLTAALAGTLAARFGAECVAIELAGASLPFACVAYVAVKRRRGVSSMRLIAVAAAGALAGQGALQLTCTQSTSAPHLLVFHFGGILLATLLAAIASRSIVKRSSEAGANGPA